MKRFKSEIHKLLVSILKILKFLVTNLVLLLHPRQDYVCFVFNLLTRLVKGLINICYNISCNISLFLLFPLLEYC